MHQSLTFQYEILDSRTQLREEDALLLDKANEASGNAYAPYSNFRVGAVARLKNGKLVSGSNQENASYPVGLCAERVLLSTVASLYPTEQIDTIAITYRSENGMDDHPVAPCGICRQSLHEYEERVGQPIRLILSGATGNVVIIPKAGDLLPLAFTKDELK